MNGIVVCSLDMQQHNTFLRIIIIVINLIQQCSSDSQPAHEKQYKISMHVCMRHMLYLLPTYTIIHNTYSRAYLIQTK